MILGRCEHKRAEPFYERPCGELLTPAPFSPSHSCSWNFTPAPGWTKEEAQILKLCLMKHGVGRWIQILETGLLPGKLIQQLNGQTQRLLGQQSLAAYTGLQVDIDRIRADNDKLVDAERKNGLVINSGREWRRAESCSGCSSTAGAQAMLCGIKRLHDLLRCTIQRYVCTLSRSPTAANLTKQQKQQLQEEAKAK